MSFRFSCKVNLTAAEQELINKYQVGGHPLTYRTVDGEQVLWHPISDLVNGMSQEVDDVATLLRNEEVIKGACREFQTLLDVMNTFGGEEVIDIG